eukprot:scaffold281729_cov41-Tisochrysis_lutea.AAC.1
MSLALTSVRLWKDLCNSCMPDELGSFRALGAAMPCIQPSYETIAGLLPSQNVNFITSSVRYMTQPPEKLSASLLGLHNRG